MSVGFFSVHSHILLDSGTSNAPMVSAAGGSSVTIFGRSHAPGIGLKLSFLSVDVRLPSGLLPLSGDNASKDETLANKDILFVVPGP